MTVGNGARPWVHKAAAALAILGLAGSAAADGLHGRLAVTGSGAWTPADSYDTALGWPASGALTTDLRLQWQAAQGPWTVDLHYHLTAETGSAVELARARGATAVPPATYFDLSTTLTDSGRTRAMQQIDRLSLSYASGPLVVKLGRQALTWGAGQVFHPMDLVDPFAPEATDTEYKPGVDMAYLQWLLPDGSDLQAVWVPRPEVTGGPVSPDASTVALHYRRDFGALGTTVLLGRDHGDTTLGLGLSGSLGGAAWNMEVVPTWADDGTRWTSALANISTATTLAGRNATVFAELYLNGFGATTNGTALDMLPPALAARLARGQLYATSRHYLAAGMTLEWTPLVTLSPGLVLNLDDGSALFAPSLHWSLSDITALDISASVPTGRTGTEFGGLPLTTGATTYAVPPKSVDLRFTWHF
ncbi:MAG: hypothetical protein GC146_13155 [Limimaricola sp.]|uniref:hypothetical protein n=1 Tax=Limimaricola sp. TaxID=2211665 RepID=UPI001E058C00|nr:hypothetical protein [Limimaricola sp.]MBI1418164.1 hypothetical protein [Limimaricola sp.]